MTHNTMINHCVILNGVYCMREIKMFKTKTIIFCYRVHIIIVCLNKIKLSHSTTVMRERQVCVLEESLTTTTVMTSSLLLLLLLFVTAKYDYRTP